VALARRDEGDWAIRFRNFDLALLVEETNAVRRTGLARRANGAPWITSRDEMEAVDGTQA
jgi:hypothetical protein